MIRAAAEALIEFTACALFFLTIVFCAGLYIGVIQ